MLIIRLQPTGKKNARDFRIVLAEKESPVQKKFTEVLGSYNPRSKNFQVKEDRVKYWLSQHIALSATVHNLFVTKGLLDAPKVKAFSVPKKPAEPAAETPVAETAAAPAETPAAEAPAEPVETPAAEAENQQPAA